MGKEEKLIDQSQLAEDVSKKIIYEFADHFLVKPLDPIKVKKEFTKLPEKDKTTDENNIEAVDYDEKELIKEVKEVDSDYRKGVVLKVPYEYQRAIEDEKFPRMNIKVGDIVVYDSRFIKYFDLLKDTQLLRSYDIMAVERA